MLHIYICALNPFYNSLVGSNCKVRDLLVRLFTSIFHIDKASKQFSNLLHLFQINIIQHQEIQQEMWRILSPLLYLLFHQMFRDVGGVWRLPYYSSSHQAAANKPRDVAKSLKGEACFPWRPMPQQISQVSNPSAPLFSDSKTPPVSQNAETCSCQKLTTEKHHYNAT